MQAEAMSTRGMMSDSKARQQQHQGWATALIFLDLVGHSVTGCCRCFMVVTGRLAGLVRSARCLLTPIGSDFVHCSYLLLSTPTTATVCSVCIVLGWRLSAREKQAASFALKTNIQGKGRGKGIKGCRWNQHRRCGIQICQRIYFVRWCYGTA